MGYLKIPLLLVAFLAALLALPYMPSFIQGNAILSQAFFLILIGGFLIALVSVVRA
jgi:hypothetical protein